MSSRRNDTNDILDRLLAPVFEFLAARLPARISPNQITYVSGLCGLGASAVLIFLPGPEALLIAAFLILVYSFLDNMDGIHARKTGRGSKLGGFIDHAFDAAITPLIFLALVFRFGLQHPVFLSVVYLRSVANSIGFCSEVAVGRLFIPKIGPTVESYLTVVLFVYLFFFPGPGGTGEHVLLRLPLSLPGLPNVYGAFTEFKLNAIGLFFLTAFLGSLLGYIDIIRFTWKEHGGKHKHEKD